VISATADKICKKLADSGVRIVRANDLLSTEVANKSAISATQVISDLIFRILTF
jgi:hypothetical protein